MNPIEHADAEHQKVAAAFVPRARRWHLGPWSGVWVPTCHALSVNVVWCLMWVLPEDVPHPHPTGGLCPGLCSGWTLPTEMLSPLVTKWSRFQEMLAITNRIILCKVKVRIA